MTYAQIYKQAITNGCTPLFADMLASRVAPGAVTDESFTRGQGTLDKQMGSDPSFRGVIASAKRQGFTPNRNDIYLPSIARFVGDKDAFVPSGAGARGYIKRIAEKQNINLVGVVEHTKHETPPDEAGMSKSRMREELAKLRAADKHAVVADDKSLRQEVLKKNRQRVL